MHSDVEVRPGKTYLVMGIVVSAVNVIFAIGAIMQKDLVLFFYYLFYIFSFFSIFSIVSFVFYFRTKIFLLENTIVIQPTLGKRREWYYSQISEVYIYENQGNSRPIMLKHNGKKMIKIVYAFSGYDEFEKKIQEKCRGNIVYVS